MNKLTLYAERKFCFNYVSKGVIWASENVPGSATEGECIFTPTGSIWILITESKHIHFQYSDARQEKRLLCAQNGTMTSCYVTSCHVTLCDVMLLFTFI